MKLHKASRLHGEVTVPGDKSISHRSVMFGSIAKGTTEIHNFLEGADCISTISCFRNMGIEIEQKKNTHLFLCILFFDTFDKFVVTYHRCNHILLKWGLR